MVSVFLMKYAMLGVYLVLTMSLFAPARSSAQVASTLSPSLTPRTLAGHDQIVASTSTPPHEELDCPICLEPLSISNRQRLRCGHEFHEGCVTKWRLYGDTCPICRMPIRDPIDNDRLAADLLNSSVVAVRLGAVLNILCRLAGINFMEHAALVLQVIIHVILADKLKWSQYALSFETFALGVVVSVFADFIPQARFECPRLATPDLPHPLGFSGAMAEAICHTTRSTLVLIPTLCSSAALLVVVFKAFSYFQHSRSSNSV